MQNLFSGGRMWGVGDNFVENLERTAIVRCLKIRKHFKNIWWHWAPPPPPQNNSSILPYHKKIMKCYFKTNPILNFFTFYKTNMRWLVYLSILLSKNISTNDISRGGMVKLLYRNVGQAVGFRCNQSHFHVYKYTPISAKLLGSVVIRYFQCLQIYSN